MPKPKSSKFKDEQKKRILIHKDETEEYGKIIKCLGDRNVIVILTNNKEIQARIPGRFKRKCYMVVGDVVLLSSREFEDKYDIIHKYNANEVKQLNKQEEIPNFFLNYSTTSNYEDDDTEIFFEEEENNDKPLKNKVENVHQTLDDDFDIDNI